ncbi:MAG: hypothetical protein KY462_14470 [Actinobacteria bacterium]|nr:hypothetical protein [Actinomycetota bacterium]
MASGRDDETGDADQRAGAERPPQQEGRPEPRPAPTEPAPLSQTVGRVVLGVLALLFMLLSLDNLHPVPIEWLWGGRGGAFPGEGIPLIVLLLGSFVFGMAVGAGFAWRRGRIRRARWEREQAGR